MTLLEIMASLCTSPSGRFSLFLGVEKLLIFGQYSIIAMQFFLSRNQNAAGEFANVTAQQGKGAQIALVLIFFLCAITGYLGIALQFPIWLLTTLHGFLIVANAWFIWKRQAAVVMASINQ